MTMQSIMKDGNWSLNLEDSYYEEHIDEMLDESFGAVKSTREGSYVNLVTPADYGDPCEQLVPQLQTLLDANEIPIKEIRYIDQCGCGGFVTRVYR